ncbi:MAG: hypothetical protein KHX31_04435 [Akkermansia sp.]|uniref:hypothetical protein n=1 Tax=Akkermansia sp. TaxID=1872421 RepID=UPI0025BA0E83|nr:hypothetical protein [Akkermansia sp.]MBS5507866.1 hypothetical protein [Akkermansia sp.]
MLFRAVFSAAAILFTGVSCSSGPYRPVSPLITHAADLKETRGTPGGVWRHTSAGQFLWEQQRGQYVYIAPVEISSIRQQLPEASPYLAREFRNSLQKEVRLLIDRNNEKPGHHVRWVPSDRPHPPDVKVSLAIVHLKPTDVGGKVAAPGVGIVSPIPGVSFIINHFASGEAGIEDNIVSLDNGTILKEFYGRNRDSINIFSCNSFEEFACDKYNLDRFARQIEEILEEDPSHS